MHTRKLSLTVVVHFGLHKLLALVDAGIDDALATLARNIDRRVLARQPAVVGGNPPPLEKAPAGAADAGGHAVLRGQHLGVGGVGVQVHLVVQEGVRGHPAE
jgi:hypothetical protein